MSSSHIFQTSSAKIFTSSQDDSQSINKYLNPTNFIRSSQYFPPKFVEDLIQGLNYNINLNKAKELIEEDARACSIADINKFLAILIIMNLYRFPSYKDHFKLNFQKIYRSPAENLLGFQRFCLILSNLRLKISSLADISRTVLGYFTSPIENVSTSSNKEFLIVERKDFIAENFSLVLLFKEFFFSL